jgi:hypothetical protein
MSDAVRLMPALTICQPYAYLITLPHTDPRHKRVENRTWPTSHRGDLVIHAGKSREWLHTYDEGEITVAEMMAMPFGAVVAVADMTACMDVGDIDHLNTSHPMRWLRSHPHCEGPVCWVLENVRVLRKPIPAKGAQGIWQWTPQWPLDFRMEEQADE